MQEVEFFKDLNKVFENHNLAWKVVSVAKQPTTGGSTEPIVVKSDTPEQKIVFEDFPGLVHLYALKDSNGKNVTRYEYTDAKGKKQFLQADGITKAICVLDFRAFTDLNGWKVDFVNTEGLVLTEKETINGFYAQEGDRFTIVSAKGNAQVKAGERLKMPVVFVAPLINNKAPIAYDFRVSAASTSPEITTPVTPVTPGKEGENKLGKYGEALAMNYLFYEANLLGKKPTWSRISWRGDSCMNDGKQEGIDLAGRDGKPGVAIADAGDHIVTALGTGTMVHLLNFAAWAFPKALDNSGQRVHHDNNMKNSLYYLLRTIVWENADTIKEVYHWVSHSSKDHQVWCKAEDVENEMGKRGNRREAFKITRSTGSTESISNMISAFGSGVLLYEKTDPGLVSQLKKAMLALHKFEYKDYQKKWQETSHTSNQTYDVYKSSSGWKDELATANAYMYLVFNDNAYLEEAKAVAKDVYLSQWNYCDNWSYSAYILLAKITGEAKYKDAIKNLASAWMKADGSWGISKIHGTFPAFTSWGSNPNTSAPLGMFCYYNDYIEKIPGIKEYAKKQLDFILGNNPHNLCFMVGFNGLDGKKSFPKTPHHRGADVNKQVLKGAVTGGFDMQGNYDHSKDNYITNEVSINYNSCVMLLLMGVLN